MLLDKSQRRITKILEDFDNGILLTRKKVSITLDRNILSDSKIVLKKRKISLSRFIEEKLKKIN